MIPGRDDFNQCITIIWDKATYIEVKWSVNRPHHRHRRVFCMTRPQSSVGGQFYQFSGSMLPLLWYYAPAIHEFHDGRCNPCVIASAEGVLHLPGASAPLSVARYGSVNGTRDLAHTTGHLMIAHQCFNSLPLGTVQLSTYHHSIPGAPPIASPSNMSSRKTALHGVPRVAAIASLFLQLLCATGPEQRT